MREKASKVNAKCKLTLGKCMSMLEGLRKLYTAPSYGNEMKIVAAEIDR